MPRNQPSPNARRSPRRAQPANAASGTISLIAGSFDHRIARVWGDRIAEYLLAPDSRRHVWHCWLASPTANLDRPDLYQFLTFARSKQIIPDGYGWSPPGLLSALSKLGARARSKEFYAALFEVLARGGPVAVHIQHMTQIEDQAVSAWASPRLHAMSDQVTKAALKSPTSIQHWNELCWVIDRLYKLVPSETIDAAVSTSQNPLATIERLVAQLPFPSPPFHHPQLQPIVSGSELRRAGRSYKNCLADHRIWLDAALSVQSGQTYYYRWQTDQPVLLAFAKIGTLGWTLSEFGGPGNTAVPEAVKRAIRVALEDVREVAPIGTPPRFLPFG